MATIGTLIIQIGANVDGLRKGLREGHEEVEKASTKFAGAGKVMKGAVVAGAAAATAAVVGLGAAAIGVGAQALDMASQMQQSQNAIQAQLGVTEARAEQLGEVAVNVFKDNFAGSVEEATQAVITARQQLGDLTDTELQDATENAFRLADAFGVDVGESLSAARTLMSEFGLSQQEAFDFLATGFQTGLDASGDFLDTVGEYSNLFAQSGADAGQFFSLMESGLSGGVLGTDKAADAFKEFQIRFLEGGDDIESAISSLSGDSWGMFMDEIRSGDTTVADMAGNVIKWLNDIEDPIERNRLGVAMFGTQFEDLGMDAVLGINMATTSLEEMAGATDKLDKQYDSLGSVFEGLKRRALVAIAPIGEKLLGLANQAMPYVEKAFAWFEKQLPSLIDKGVVVLDQLAQFITTNVLPILVEWGDWFLKQGLPAIVEFVTPILQQLIPGLVQLATWAGDIAGVVFPLLGQAIQFVIEHFNLIGPILAVVAGIILALTAPITLVIGAIVLLATAWANNWGGIQEKVQAVVDFISPLIEGAMTFISGVVTSVLDFIQGWWAQHGDSVMTIVQFLWTTVTTLFNLALTGIRTTIETWIGIIQRFWQRWGDTITEIARLAWDSIKIIIQTALDIIGFIIDAAAALIRGDWDALGQALQNIWSAAWDAIGQIVENAKEGLVLAVQQIRDEAIEVWSNIRDRFVEIGGSIVSGIQEGIESARDQLLSFMRDLAQSLMDIVNDTLGINSPSLMFIDVGRNINAGLALGLERSRDMPERAASQTVTHITNQFQQTIYSQRAPNAAHEFQQMRSLLST